MAASLLTSSGRRKYSAFLLEGKKLIDEAVACGYNMQECFVAENDVEKYSNYNAIVVSQTVFKKITETENPQGIAAVFSFKTLTPEKNDRVVVLENIQDPGNFGTIIRTSEALGISLICTVGTAPDRYSGKVMRSAMGAALRMPIKAFSDTDEAFAYFTAENINVYAAVLDSMSAKLTDTVFHEKCAAAIGNEGSGLTPEFISRCKNHIYIPMSGVTESLNASAAASILIWEMCR